MTPNDRSPADPETPDRLPYSEPGARIAVDDLRPQADRVARSRIAQLLLDVLPGPGVVLSEQRQIIATNARFLDLAGGPGLEGLLGKRPGEALLCVDHEAGDDGCGTSDACQLCGMGRAVSDAGQRKGIPTVNECRLTTALGDKVQALDIAIRVVLVDIEDEPVYLVGLADLSGAKRRQVLERVFFHDVTNLAGGVHALSTMLADAEPPPPEEAEDIVRMLHDSSGALLEEIEYQRRLLGAESGDLECLWETLDARAVLHSVRSAYANHTVAMEKTVDVLPGAPLTLTTDRVLVERVLGNLTKNALEASSEGDSVTLDVAADDESVTFTVHNPGVMPLDVQRQLFKRSFSTKGESGRGIGTYSVMLFTETYLHGSVSFDSAAGRGTTFRVRLPLTPPDETA